MANEPAGSKATTVNFKLKSALAYARRGFLIIPLHNYTKAGCSCGKQSCPSPAKHPLIIAWPNAASTDESKIKEWWAKWPHANIGIVTGASSCLVVLDFDVKTGGANSFKQLQAQYGPLPAGPLVRSGGGGRHVYFLHPGGRVVTKASVLSGLPGIDIRADGGYIVAPPSSHASGTRYKWMVGRSPSDIALPSLPQWLLKKLQPQTAGMPSGDLSSPGNIPEGKRNNTLTTLAGKMRASGMTPAAIEIALLAENTARCVPPLPASEVRQIAASVSKYPTRSGSRGSQTDQLVALGTEHGTEFFHTREGDTYASVNVAGHRETWPVSSPAFKDILRRNFYRLAGKTPSSAAEHDAIKTIQAKAKYESPEHSVFTRVGESNGKLYLDLVNDAWEAIEITEQGWSITSNPPVRFIRRRGMGPLPHPEKGGTLDQLWDSANVKDEEHRLLILGFLVAALRPNGPYPVLVLHGEHGSAKSTLARLLRALVDPNSAPLRSEPSDEQDLILAAHNGWLVNLDNLSKISTRLSDALCRLSTGGGIGKRQLFTDNDEVLIDVQRPAIVNGIEELATRADLLDRSLILYLPQIEDKNRKQEVQLWSKFSEVQPRLLGALLDAVSTAIRNLPNTKLAAPPRLADFATWATAAEPAFGSYRISFLEAYNHNRNSANELVLEASPVADALKQWMNDPDWEPFSGTAAMLLHILDENVPDSVRKSLSWPKNARALSNKLRQVVPNLRSIGISVTFGGRRIIQINQC